MPKISKIFLLAVSVILVLVVFLGANTSGVSASAEPQQGAYRQINVYSEVLRHIQTDYVEEPNIPEVTSGALHGLLESLDADSSYLPAADYKAFKANKDSKAQVGLNVSKRYGYAIVVSSLPGSPADRANLNDGDVIEAIDGRDTRDLSLAVIRMLLAGEPGSKLTLAVIRPRRSKPDEIALTRMVVQAPPMADSAYDNSTILYLKLSALDREQVQQVESKLKAMPKAGNKKILLDLRDVASGDIAEATRLANFFLKSGTIATLEGQKVARQTFTADPSKTINATAPMVVLVNRGTSGPAELVAAALLDNHRADLVGEKTFGGGVAQQKTFELQDGAALILSVAKYSSPSGKKLEDGVTPGTLVASNLDDSGPVDEESMGTESQPAPPQKPAVTVDDQLNKALDMLKSKPA